jgi:hypothetical protein
MCQLLVTLYVALCLALLDLGGSDPTSVFCLRTVSFGRPLRIEGPVGDMTSISHAIIAGVMCEE